MMGAVIGDRRRRRRTPTMAAYTYYHASEPRGMKLVCNSPEVLRQFIQERESCPSGRYDVFESHAVLLPSDHAGPRWGVAVKQADGSVELVRDGA